MGPIDRRWRSPIPRPVTRTALAVRDRPAGCVRLLRIDALDLGGLSVTERSKRTCWGLHQPVAAELLGCCRWSRAAARHGEVLDGAARPDSGSSFLRAHSCARLAVLGWADAQSAPRDAPESNESHRSRRSATGPRSSRCLPRSERDSARAPVPSHDRGAAWAPRHHARPWRRAVSTRPPRQAFMAGRHTFTDGPRPRRLRVDALVDRRLSPRLSSSRSGTYGATPESPNFR